MLRIHMKGAVLGLKALKALGAIVLLWGAVAPARAAAWVPTKPVEFVVLAGQTGSSGKAVNLILEIIKKHNLGPVTFAPLYKDGRSGAEGFSYFVKHPDPDHVVLISSTAYYAVPMRHPELGADTSLFTPIAGMGSDVLMVWVPTEQKNVNNLSDFVKAVRDKKARTGQDWVMAGFGEESIDRLFTDFVDASYQIDMKYLPQSSSGEATRRLLEGKADSVIGTPAVLGPHARAGKVKPVLSLSEKRPPEFATVPTFSDSEGKFSVEIPRLIAGPQAMSLEAQQFYVQLFKKIFDSAEWQAYRNQNGLHGRFLTGPELADFSLRQEKAHRMMAAVIDAVKMIKSTRPAPEAPARVQARK